MAAGQMMGQTMFGPAFGGVNIRGQTVSVTRSNRERIDICRLGYNQFTEHVAKEILCDVCKMALLSRFLPITLFRGFVEPFPKITRNNFAPHHVVGYLSSLSFLLTGFLD